MERGGGKERERIDLHIGWKSSRTISLIVKKCNPVDLGVNKSVASNNDLQNLKL